MSEEILIGEESTPAPAATERPRRGRPPNVPRPAPQEAHAAPDNTPRLSASEDDPRTRARRRAEELRGHRGDIDDGVDKFYIDPRIIPEGWSYEWKRLTVVGKEDPSYQVSLARAGWESVPLHRHPEMMPQGFSGNLIERDGMILMERPKEITDEARMNELRKARAQVRQKEAQLQGAPAGENSPFEATNKGSPLVKIGKTYEPVAVPVPKE